MRRERAAKGIRMFKPAELRRILADANPQVKAMVLLAVNCGFGNTDVTTLPLSAVDLAGGWVSYPRPKTGIEPPLSALAGDRNGPGGSPGDTQVPEGRPTRGRVLHLTAVRTLATGTKGTTGVTHEFRKILDKLGLYRKGLSFYTLRHVFQTIGDEVGDYLATRRIMGHADDSMARRP